MKRSYWIVVLAGLIALGVTGLALAEGAYPFTGQQGYFISLTDIHNGVADKASQELAKAIAALPIPPKYIFVGGDLTEMGARYEYGKLKKNYEPLLGKVPFGWMLGNHDARWSEQGYYLFEKELGPPYFVVDFGKFAFIGLNSSTLLEQHGHFGEAQVQWLKNKLAEIGQDKPIIVQMHHPSGGPSQYTDDGDKILEALKGYNVPLILVGHGHSYSVAGSYNHSWIQMLGAGMNKNYTPISWDENNLYLWQANLDSGVKLLKTIPFKQSGKEELDWIVEPVYKDKVLYLFVRTQGIKKINATFNGEKKSFEIPKDGVQKLVWEMANPLPGKDTLHVEGVGATTTMLLASEVTGNLKEVRWAFASGDSLYTQPTIDEKAIYFGNEAGTFYALDRQTGTKLWSYQTNAAILSSPALVGNSVIFGSTDTNLYALNKATGALIWKKQLSGVIYGGVTTGQKNIAVGTGDYQIYGINPETADILWKANGWGMIQSTGTYYDGKFIFTSWGGVVSVLDEMTGKTVQTFASGSGYETPAPSIPVVMKDRVLFTNTGNKYVGQSLTDKKNVWTITDIAAGYSSVAVDEAFGYISTLKGEVIKFNPENGEKIWRVDLPQPVYDSSPQIFKGYLVVGTTEGDIWILRRDTGATVKHLSLGSGFIFGKIRATADTLYVGSMDGTLYAVDVSGLK